ncbi:hypothetical protein [Peptostreptococcus canis]|uniref:Uncharacterized protein n=1 Tax=Peptostreptococcus canis TaxID=1159213 RepID=A0ABR6TIY8_9FIRM|nr:hypothetical protein [Peptostreptococcus canis]MBC2575383.1 hypothetical protein [Peptostreptococcus canis]MBP1997434.1 hypothetical protein [Peptostreptococcus canis]
MVENKNMDFVKCYNRIVQQEKFVQAVIKVSEEQMLGLNLSHELDERFGNVEFDDIDKVIEKNENNPKWLEKNLSIIENRLAYAVKKVIEADEGQIINLKEEFYKLGQEVNIEYKDLPMKEMYEVIRDFLLDGGKSEELNKLVDESVDEIVWTRARPSTVRYWVCHDIDFKKYYIPLRRAFIHGLLEKTDIEFKTLDDTVFMLSRR